METVTFEQVVSRGCGIDVHKKTVVASKLSSIFDEGLRNALVFHQYGEHASKDGYSIRLVEFERTVVNHGIDNGLDLQAIEDFSQCGKIDNPAALREILDCQIGRAHV